MSTNKTEILVYADWVGMTEPQKIGVLSAQQAKGKKAFSFEYDVDWLASKKSFLLDPDISFFKGQQYPNRKENFGVFMDSMPDTWGRTLMRRRADLMAKEKNIKTPTLYDIDFLIGVFDECRMGALRFKLNEESAFLDDNKLMPTPPWSSIRDLQYAASIIENDDNTDAIKKWIAILMAPGSSLGGARPKANILDENGNLWIAKFPSINDKIDKGAWEYLAYTLAIKSGIEMSYSKIEKIAGKHHTFFTKRFDRLGKQRIHFASAMTMTGNNEDTIKENPAGYLDIAEFIQFYGAENKKDLAQLWRRIVFNIAISNTDDHLRNHGFILIDNGWRLSPAFDINPSIDKDGLAINIDTNSNDLNLDLAFSIGPYFHLTVSQMKDTIVEMKAVVSTWRKVANSIGISRQEQEMMSGAFRAEDWG